MMRTTILLLLLLLLSCGPKKETQQQTSSAKPAGQYDVIIRHGTIYNGSGEAGFQGDVGIKGDKIIEVGDLSNAKAAKEVNATGLAVAPGFINMLSQSMESLIADGHSEGDIRQGVTLEVFGEGWSMGPLNEQMKKESVEQETDIKYPITWTTLSEY